MRFPFTKHGFRCTLLCFVLLFTGCQPTSLPCDSELNSQYDWENDLVIVGDAIPTLIAAIEAHDQGVEDILVIVSSLKPDFTSFHSADLPHSVEILTEETDRYAALGAAAQRADQSQRRWTLTEIEQFYTEYFSELTLSADSSLFRTTVEHSGADVDWLIERCGVPFAEPVPGLLPDYKLMMTPDDGQTEGHPVVLSALTQLAADLGIAFMENSRLTQILLNEAQEGVEGVKVVQSFSDEETGQLLNYSPKIKTNALIVADQFLSKDVFLRGHLISDFTPLQLEDWESAASLQEDYDYFTLPNIIFLNADGRRFFNEKDPKMNYQDQLIWIAKQEPVYGISDLDHVQAAGISPQTFYFEVDGLNLLANMINPEYPGIVKKTITDYNQYARTGLDLEFQREGTTMSELIPPYVLVEFHTSPSRLTLNKTLLPVSSKGEVLSYASDNNKFDGLYSVYGEDTKCPGWELTSGLVWARITAQSAAAQLLKK